MSNFSTYKIGRNSDMDIRIDDPTVSRIHAELVVTANGEYYLTDCDSSGGSYVARNGEWIPIRQDFISPDGRDSTRSLSNHSPPTHRYGCPRGCRE